jgi:hypothetical protein
MTNDPNKNDLNKYDQNKKENQSNTTAGQTGQQSGQPHEKQQSGQQHNTMNDSSQKRPTQGGSNVEQDQQREDRTGQRKAS